MFYPFNPKNYLGYENVRVRLPNGRVRMAEVTSGTRNGYRSCRITTSFNGTPVKVRGRISARHGFQDQRIHRFEVQAEDAPYVYTLNEEVGYLVAA
jgi:hypothetical protein